LNTENPATN